jgi:hypothetical protein
LSCGTYGNADNPNGRRFGAATLNHQNRAHHLGLHLSRESIKSLVGAGFGIGLTVEPSFGANFTGAL